MSVVLNFKGIEILVTEVYHPLSTADQDFIDNLESLVVNSKKYKFSFICGDFNYDLLKSHLHGPTLNFSYYMIENNYVPYINKPTRVTHASCTLIDNIFVKTPNLNENVSYVITDGMSDHYPCLLSLNVGKRSKTAEDLIMNRRKLTDENIPKIQQGLLMYDWTPLYQMANCKNQGYEFLNNAVTSVLDEFALLNE